MKKTVSVFVLVFTLLLLTLTHTCQGLSIDPKVSVDTGEIGLGFGVKVRVIYEASVALSKPSSAQPGQTTTWTAQLSGGTLSISIYVPSPINKWYTSSKSAPVGSYVDIPVTTGIDARIKVLSSCSLSLSGPGSLDRNSLTWEAEGAKSFTVNVRSDAKMGEKITVDMSFRFPIYVGVVIDLLLLKREIASANIGTFIASPKLSESMSIGAAPFEVHLHVVMLAIFTIFVITIVGYALYRHRKLHRQPQLSTTVEKRSTNFCNAYKAWVKTIFPSFFTKYRGHS